MDYDWMLQAHKENNADATIAVVEVPWEETSRFGIMRTDEAGRIIEFAEKPKDATSNLASMGVYMFTWSVLKDYLMKDAADPKSSNDFGKDIIPQLLKDNANLMAYRYEGYWKDVGTIHSLWEANMDLLQEKPSLNLNDHGWRIYSQNPNQPAQYIAPTAQLTNSLVNEGCEVAGRVDHSVLFYGVQVEEECHIIDSVIMPNVKIGRGAVIRRSIVGEGTIIGEGCQIGSVDGEITLIPGGETIL